MYQGPRKRLFDFIFDFIFESVELQRCDSRKDARRTSPPRLIFQIRKSIKSRSLFSRRTDVCPKNHDCEGRTNREASYSSVCWTISSDLLSQQFRPGRSIALNRMKSSRRGETAFAAPRRARTTLLSVVDLFPKRFHCTSACEFRDGESEKVQREESTEREVPAFEARSKLRLRPNEHIPIKEKKVTMRKSHFANKSYVFCRDRRIDYREWYIIVVSHCAIICLIRA